MTFPPIIGHRGAAGLAPENTLASFRQAAGLGAKMVEFDVRLSADNQPVVFHDDTLDRTSTGRGALAAQTLAQLKRLDAGAWFSPRFAGETIPTLDEVLALCLDLGLMVNLEIKPDCGREIQTARIALGQAQSLWPATQPAPLISSFTRDCLSVAQEIAPDWPRALLVDRIPADWKNATQSYDCRCIHANHRELESGQVAEALSSGLLVSAYTVNDLHLQRQLWQMGVSSIFTDLPHSS